METEQKFYVYVDFKKDDGKPFYVGKGAKKRIHNLRRNQLHTRIKNKHGMIRKVILETHSEQEAFQKEIELIQELKTHVDFGEGGANFTLGGEGSSGISEITRKNKSEMSKKLWENPEHREKMSEARRKMWENREHRENHSEKIKKNYEDPDFKEKMKKLIYENDEVKKKLSESSKSRMNDVEFKEKMKKLIYDNQEVKEKVSESNKKRWEDPETKKKISENIKLGTLKLTPEQRSERTRKAWETRRLQNLEKEK